MESPLAGDLVFITISALAALNGLALAIYIWFRRNRNLIPNLLVTIFLVLSIYRITELTFHHLNEVIELPKWAMLIVTTHFPVLLLTGPLLLFYYKAVTISEFRFRKVHFIHLLPFIFLLPFSFLKYDLVVKVVGENFYFYVYLLIRLQFLVYLIACYSYYRKLITVASSDSSKSLPESTILRNILYAFSLLWFFSTIIYPLNLPVKFIEPLSYATIIYLLIWFEIRGHKVTELNNFNSRYKRSLLTEESSQDHLQRVRRYLEDSCSYRQPDLTLALLAKNLSITPHMLSQVINEQTSQNFNDFINEYRVKDACADLVDNSKKNLTIASIAYDCGFNSISSFNTAFRKFTGETPSKFRKDCKTSKE